MTYDLDTPEGRFAAAEALTPAQYNALMQEDFKRRTVATEGGRAIYGVSSRWGRLYMVEGLARGWLDLEKAKADARENPKEGHGSIG